MKLTIANRSATVTSRDALLTALETLDQCGGGEFWLASEAGHLPALAIRLSGQLADVHYFPGDGHPGFRLLGDLDLPIGGTTLFVYEGCDPFSGESVPNEFVTSASRALSIAGDFFETSQKPEPGSWFEL